MPHILNEVSVEMPLGVLVLLGIAHAYYDSKAEVRSDVGSKLRTEGVTAGDSLWNVTRDVAVLEDGTKVDCVRLTKRKHFWDAGKAEPPVDYLFPFEALRNGIGVDVVLAEVL